MTATRLVLAAALLLGIAIGIGAFTFVYARGASYLTNDPAACANCHIMSEHFDAWTKSSHRSVAVCNDCHTPHNSVIAKYATKARNGFWHSYYFTVGGFPDPLRITERNYEITEHACRDCHDAIVDAIEPAAHAGENTDGAGDHDDASISCIRCHRHVGHWVR